MRSVGSCNCRVYHAKLRRPHSARPAARRSERVRALPGFPLSSRARSRHAVPVGPRDHANTRPGPVPVACPGSRFLAAACAPQRCSALSCGRACERAPLGSPLAGARPGLAPAAMAHLLGGAAAYAGPPQPPPAPHRNGGGGGVGAAGGEGQGAAAGAAGGAHLPPQLPCLDASHPLDCSRCAPRPYRGSVPRRRAQQAAAR